MSHVLFFYLLFLNSYLIKWEFLNIKTNYLGGQLHLPRKINLMLNLYIIFYRSTKLYIYMLKCTNKIGEHLYYFYNQNNNNNNSMVKQTHLKYLF